MQKVVTFNADNCDELLQKYLDEGWRVVTATPILAYRSDIGYGGGWAYAGTYTKYIQYVLEKEETPKQTKKPQEEMIMELKNKTGYSYRVCKCALHAVNYKGIQEAVQYLLDHKSELK